MITLQTVSTPKHKKIFLIFCIQDSAKYVILVFTEGSIFAEQGLKQVPKLYTDSSGMLRFMNSDDE